MSGYNLYESLGLSRAHPPEELARQLDQRAAELRSQGLTDQSPQVDEVLIARTVLGDATKRTEYDRALDAAAGTAPEADVPWIRELAQRSAAGNWSAAAAGPAGPSSTAPGFPVVLDRFLTPLPVAAATVILLVVTFGMFFLSWGQVKMTEDGEKLRLSVNGFGHVSMEVTGWGSMTAGDTRPLYAVVSLVILVLFVVAAVLLAATRESRFGALLLAVAGGLLALYGLWALIVKLGAEDAFGGEDNWGSLPSASVGAGAVIGLILGLVTLLIGVTAVLRMRGPLLPQAWSEGRHRHSAQSEPTPAAGQ
jgi:hypothetical protein